MSQYLIQPIAITIAGHFDMCQAVALASAQSVAHIITTSTNIDPLSYEIFKTWITGSMAKRVARITKPAQLKKLREIAKTYETKASEASSGNAIAIALPPMPFAELPREMSTLQVSDTQGDRHIKPELLPSHILQPHIEIPSTLGMSTGKTAAQAAHATTLFLQMLNPKELEYWLKHPSLYISDLSKDDKQRKSILEVHDNGKTEIKPGSITAIVTMPKSIT